MCQKVEYLRKANFENFRKKNGIPLDRPKRKYNRIPVKPIEFKEGKVIVYFD